MIRALDIFACHAYNLNKGVSRITLSFIYKILIANPLPLMKKTHKSSFIPDNMWLDQPATTVLKQETILLGSTFGGTSIFGGRIDRQANNPKTDIID